VALFDVFNNGIAFPEKTGKALHKSGGES